MLNLRDLAAQVDAWHVRLWPAKTLSDQLHKLSEEAGEVSGAFVKWGEGRATLDDLAAEIGDTCIALAAVANKAGLDLDEVVSARWAEVSKRTYGMTPSALPRGR